MPGSRRALVEASREGGGRGGPVEEMEPVEADRPRTCGETSPSSATGF